jgi:hypothetical protein
LYPLKNNTINTWFTDLSNAYNNALNGGETLSFDNKRQEIKNKYPEFDKFISYNFNYKNDFKENTNTSELAKMFKN